MGGISFARAATYYDATRALPDAAAERVTSLLAGELAGRRHCLEIGVGTGRVALPLHERGVGVLGIDLARPMLDQLVAKAGGRLPFPLVAGDATRLPFATASCEAILACHVLHLVGDWQAAVEEAFRVLTPGGVLLVDFGGGVEMPWSAATAQIAAKHGVIAGRPGVSAAGEVAAYLAGRAGCRALPAIPVPVTRTLAQDLDDWQKQIFSWTWGYTTEQMRAACEDIRRWAAGEGRDLDEPATAQRTIRWLAYEST
ncbi:MAG: class I SAM-dependent methyltransferase [Actinomycetota bacterium]|nr:class I SAM-dependent methyltransferase [Actinomycetota bacterium]